MSADMPDTVESEDVDARQAPERRCPPRDTMINVFDFSEILADIVKRPFVTVGFAALVLMIPLAVTSTNAMLGRLGAARWQALHRVIYVIAPLGVLHF